MEDVKVFPTTASRLSIFFADQLQDVLNAEKKIYELWPRLQDAAHLPELRQAFYDYHALIQKELIRLEGIFTIMDMAPENREPAAIGGLLEEAGLIIDKTAIGTHTRDAAIIIAVQKIGHYKIATYGSLDQLATTLGMEQISNLLGQSLQDEKNNDILLSGIADKKINWLAEIEPGL